MLVGSIQARRDKVARSNFFYQYLGDEPAGQFLDYWDMGGHFLAGHEKATIAEENDQNHTVQATFPSNTPWGTVAVCSVVFDMDKGAIPIEMELQELEHKRYLYRFHATSPTKANDLWIPTRYELIVWSNEKPKQVTVHTGTVTDIQTGTLKAEDLEVQFPPGTDVTDSITKIQYHIAPDGTAGPPTELPPNGVQIVK
jgi:hypothetical protein